MPVKVRDLLRLLLEDGWVQVAQRGSYRQFKHPVKPGRLTVPGKPSDELARGTEESILNQAALRRPE
jgi:predicted RNA binding protein YcfA (HicA-like mRNA interferase family)